jgi:hypothetical protein
MDIGELFSQQIQPSRGVKRTSRENWSQLHSQLLARSSDGFVFARLRRQNEEDMQFCLLEVRKQFERGQCDVFEYNDVLCAVNGKEYDRARELVMEYDARSYQLKLFVRLAGNSINAE